MKALFNKLTGKGYKTRRSPLDVSAFYEKRSTDPTPAEIRAVVEKRFAADAEAKGNTKGVYGNPTEEQEVLISKKRMYYDLRYRCGARGRCLEGDAQCNFPFCFDCRPLAKGHEVFSERASFELGNATHPILKKVVEACDADELEEAIVALNVILATKEKEARGPILEFVEQQKKSKNTAADVASNEEVQANLDGTAPSEEKERIRLTKTGVAFGAKVIDELIALTQWKAAILVNLDKDEDAVDALLRLGKLLPKEYKPAALSLAAGWASFNDMEVRFFRSHVVQYPDYKPTKKGVLEKPFLLKRVIDACGEGDVGDYYLEHVVHTAFSKEVTAIISRAQGAQFNEDSTEDPIASPVVWDSVEHYRREIGGAFWQKFEKLALMPPLPPPDAKKQHAQDAAENYVGSETPQNIMDAVGRSMLLHHVAKSLELEIEKEGKQTLEAEKDKVVTRMKELLNVVRAHEVQQKQLRDAAISGAPIDPRDSTPSASRGKAAPHKPYQ